MTELVVTGLDEALLAAAREGARLALAEQGKASEPASPWLSVKSAATYLDMSQAALRALIKRGQVPYHKTPQGRILLHRDELDAYASGESA